MTWKLDPTCLLIKYKFFVRLLTWTSPWSKTEVNILSSSTYEICCYFCVFLWPNLSRTCFGTFLYEYFAYEEGVNEIIPNPPLWWHNLQKFQNQIQKNSSPCLFKLSGLFLSNHQTYQREEESRLQKKTSSC